MKRSLIMVKATTLSIWCITTTTIIAYSHAFIRISHYVPRPRSSLVHQAQRDGDDDYNDVDGMMSPTLPAAVDNHRRTMLITLLSLQQLSYHPTPSYATTTTTTAAADPISGIHDLQLQNYNNPLLPNWKGTALPGPLSLSEAYSRFILPSLKSDKPATATATTFPMAKWPDPILRKPASPLPHSIFQNQQHNNNASSLQQLQLVAETLRNTARQEGAVGLAAQQCGIDVSLIYIDGVVTTTSTSSSSSETTSYRSDDPVEMKNDNKNNDVLGALGGAFGQTKWRNSKKQITGEGVMDDDIYYNNPSNNGFTRMGKQPPKQKDGIFLVNPRIVHRSPESEMLVWTEECLVLPPEFRATLLRDAEVTIEYETLTTITDVVDGLCGETKQITLRGELARCAQHEMDHDRGILIVDHVGLDELLSMKDQTFMADVEDSDGLHGDRMQRAYAREVYDSLLLPSARSHRNVDLAFGSRNDFFAKIEVVESDMVDGNVRHPPAHPWFVPSANAIESVTENYSAPSTNAENNTRPDRSADGTAISCDDACLEERRRRIEERRAMMKQSRSSTNRGDVLELSRQRALMYGTSYKGLSPSTCVKPGFCP
eukprot:scaffold3691_cov79-Skeletonema_marinoi.AAC.2